MKKSRNAPIPAGLGNSGEPIGAHPFELSDTRAAHDLRARRERWRQRLRARGYAFELKTELDFFEELESAGWKWDAPFWHPGARLFPPPSLGEPGVTECFEVEPGFLR